MNMRHRATFAMATGVAIALISLNAGSILAHSEREVGPYTVEVGLIDEPVFVGQRSGVEIGVSLGGEPVEGLEATLVATVRQGDAERDLTLRPRVEDPGWYDGVFLPTRAGVYSIQITGDIEGTAIDETFLSGPDFGEVGEVSSAQFPVQFPGPAELADQARRGADAAGLIPVAFGLGVAGLVAGLAGLGLALGARRRGA